MSCRRSGPPCCRPRRWSIWRRRWIRPAAIGGAWGVNGRDESSGAIGADRQPGDTLGQGPHGGELPRRLLPHPARAPAACPCLLPLRARGRRHRRQSAPRRGGEGPPLGAHGRDPRRRIAGGGGDAAEPGANRACRAALPRPAAGLHHGCDQAALSRLGRSLDLLPLLGDAGRAAGAGAARRAAGHLAVVGPALRRASGAEPLAGLCRGLPRARPRLPAGARSRRLRQPGRGSRGPRRDAGIAPRHRPAARRYRPADREGAHAAGQRPKPGAQARDGDDRRTGRASVAPPQEWRSPGAPGEAQPRRFRRRAAAWILARTTPGTGMSAALQQDAPDPRAAIRARVAAAGTSFYWAMRLLPEERREAMFAIYAFCREVDDIADNDAAPAVKRAGLADWRSEVDAIFAGSASTPLSRVLADVARSYALRREDFLAVIDGME